jgi:hypothetical protein
MCVAQEKEEALRSLLVSISPDEEFRTSHDVFHDWWQA